MENVGSFISIIMIVSLVISNVLLFKCSLYLSGHTIREFSTSKMPRIRKIIRQYKKSELNEPIAEKYIKWYLITFRTFYLSLAVLLTLIVVSNL